MKCLLQHDYCCHCRAAGAAGGISSGLRADVLSQCLQAASAPSCASHLRDDVFHNAIALDSLMSLGLVTDVAPKPVAALTTFCFLLIFDVMALRSFCSGELP